MILDQPLFALHRVNRNTSETLRFQRGTFPAGPKATIEVLARGARAMKMAGDGEWDIAVLRDVRAELQILGVPDVIADIVEAITQGRQWGVSDPMYMANRVAAKLGWGDGLSKFSSTHERPSEDVVNEFAEEIHRSYETAFAELGQTAEGVLTRVWNGLMATASGVAEVPRQRG